MVFACSSMEKVSILELINYFKSEKYLNIFLPTESGVVSQLPRGGGRGLPDFVVRTIQNNLIFDVDP